MTDFPKGVRLAQKGDERRLYDLLVMAHAENGFGTMDERVVHETIQAATERKGYVIALVDGPERIEAAVGLRPAKLWYCSAHVPSNWYWTDLLFYVHPLHRRTRHAVKLFRFAQWWEQEIKQPVVLELMPRDEFAGKDKLFSRFGQKIGSSFVMGPLGAAMMGAQNATRH